MKNIYTNVRNIFILKEIVIDIFNKFPQKYTRKYDSASIKVFKSTIINFLFQSYALI